MVHTLGTPCSQFYIKSKCLHVLWKIWDICQPIWCITLKMVSFSKNSFRPTFTFQMLPHSDLHHIYIHTPLKHLTDIYRHLLNSLQGLSRQLPDTFLTYSRHLPDTTILTPTTNCFPYYKKREYLISQVRNCVDGSHVHIHATLWLDLS